MQTNSLNQFKEMYRENLYLYLYFEALRVNLVLGTQETCTL